MQVMCLNHTQFALVLFSWLKRSCAW